MALPPRYIRRCLLASAGAAALFGLFVLSSSPVLAGIAIAAILALLTWLGRAVTNRPSLVLSGLAGAIVGFLAPATVPRRCFAVWTILLLRSPWSTMQLMSAQQAWS